MFEDITPETIKAGILADLTLWNVSEGSYANTMVSGAALAIWNVYQAMNELIPMFYVDENSGAWIDAKAAEYGITRKAGAKAAVTLTFTGTSGTTIPAGSSFLTAGNLAFVTDAAVTLAAGAGTVTAKAVAVGANYNVAAGTVVSARYAIASVTAVTNAAAASGGADAETDAALVARLYTRLQNPPTSGNAYHYKAWALEISGVGYAKVLPLWNGAGTVKVLLADPDGRAVVPTIVDAAAAYIEAERPIGATVTVASAAELTINVAAAVTLGSSTTAAAVQAALEERLAEYLKTLVFENYTVNINRVGYLLLSIDGVIDYTSLTLNGGTANIAVGTGEIPVPGTVEVTAS